MINNYKHTTMKAKQILTTLLFLAITIIVLSIVVWFFIWAMKNAN